MFVTLLFILIGAAIIAVGGSLIYFGLPQDASSYYNRKAKPASKIRIILGGVAGLFGVLIFLASFGWTEIGPGQVGVVVNLGKVDNTVLSSGLNWRVPIISSIHVMDTRVQSYQFGGDAQGDTSKPENQGIETFTGENQPAYMYGVVNYSIDPLFAAQLYQTVGDDWFAKVVQSQAQAEIKQDARQYSVDEITKQRDALAKAAQERLQSDVAQYHINITGVFINNIRLSQDYLKSVEDKQIALQNVEKAKADAETVRQTAEGAADARVTQAKGEAAATVALAQGQAQANADINASLTDNLIRWQTIQKLAPDVKVWLVPSNGNNILNLGNPNQ